MPSDAASENAATEQPAASASLCRSDPDRGGVAGRPSTNFMADETSGKEAE